MLQQRLGINSNGQTGVEKLPFFLHKIGSNGSGSQRFRFPTVPLQNGSGRFRFMTVRFQRFRFGSRPSGIVVVPEGCRRAEITSSLHVVLLCPVINRLSGSFNRLSGSSNRFEFREPSKNCYFLRCFQKVEQKNEGIEAQAETIDGFEIDQANPHPYVSGRRVERLHGSNGTAFHFTPIHLDERNVFETCSRAVCQVNAIKHKCKDKLHAGM